MQIAYATQIIAETCGNCGVVFGLEQTFMSQKRQNGQLFRCPNGCSVCYGDNTLKKQLDATQRALTAAKCEIATERNAKWAALEDAAKEKLARKRLKKRVMAGVCPCCSRSFENLRRHMQTKHPKGK